MRKGVFLLLGLIGAACSNTPENKAGEIATGELTFGQVDYFIFDSPTKGSSFRYGERLNIEISDLAGFKLKDGKVHPGVIFKVVNPKGEIVQQSGDLYENNPFKSQEDETFDPGFYIDLFTPIDTGKGFKLELKMWDKIGGKSLTVNKTFDVKSPLKNGFVEIDQKGMSPLYFVLYKNGKPYAGNTFEPGDHFHAHLVLSPEFLAREMPFSAEVTTVSSTGEVVFQSMESGTFSVDIGPINSYILIKEGDYVSGQQYVFTLLLKTLDPGYYFSLKYPIQVVTDKTAEPS